jgi:hypothetical protein
MQANVTKKSGREMRLYNDLKGQCPVGIKEFHATSKGQERCQRCPTGYATEMCKKCGKHLCQVRRLYNCGGPGPEGLGQARIRLKNFMFIASPGDHFP